MVGRLHEHRLAAAGFTLTRTLQGQLLQKRRDVLGRVIVRLLDELCHVCDLSCPLADGRVDYARRDNTTGVGVVNLGYRKGSKRGREVVEARESGGRASACGVMLH